MGATCRLNLAAPQRLLERGDMLCDERLTTTSDRFDGSLEVRPTAGPIDNTSASESVGTAETFGKLVVLGAQDSVAPGHFAFCQIVLSRALPVLRGDHFIVRDETAQRTLGGGLVSTRRRMRIDVASLSSKKVSRAFRSEILRLSPGCFSMSATSLLPRLRRFISS